MISGAVASTAVTGAQAGARVLLASTDPAAGTVAAALPAASQVRVSVFAGRDQAGLTALAVSDPRSSSYTHFLSPAQVQARFGATLSQQQAVARWLAASGLTVAARGAFVITATGTAAQAGSALRAPLALSHPSGGTEQVISTQAMSVPTAIAGAVTTIPVAPATAPMPQQQPQRDLAATSGPAAAGTLKEVCSAYYGQRTAPQVPRAYGRIPSWAPCGYLPQQVRGAYGATRSGLTGQGVTVAILSGDDDKTALADSWETVLERAAVEGITVNFATGDLGAITPLQYPGSDPWVTLVGGTSLAIGSGDRYLWETAWETDETGLSSRGTRWDPPPPGNFAEGSTGGISTKFPEPYYQQGVVSGNQIDGQPMRAVPDVSALGDWNLGYQVGLTAQIAPNKFQYVNAIYGGTSLAVQLFGGLQADLIQGRHGIPLGFFNPALYDMAGTPALRDITATTQNEAVVIGPLFQNEPTLPTLSTMGRCSVFPALPCGPGYDTSTGLGSPGPEFFNSFGSHSY